MTIAAASSSGVALAVSGLSYSRSTESGETRAVFEGVELSVSRGELVDVTGPSGGGKTTLLLALARLLPGAKWASLTLAGSAAAEVRPERWRSRVALLPQKPVLVPGTVRDDLVVPWTMHVRAHDRRPDDAALDAALASVGLAEVELDRPAAKLSVGQAARVALLRVVLTEPDVMLLDEPDAALDDDSAHLVGGVIRDFVAGGGAVVRVRHLRVDEQADRRLRMADGALTEVIA